MQPPHPRQNDFLKLEGFEILYGGSAGAAKTNALLKWLGQGIHVPGYSAIYFRRTYPMLVGPGSVTEQSQGLYRPFGGKYNESKHVWKFPSGAQIQFGHLQYEQSVQTYQSREFHRVAWDELTQFLESQYIYITFSRIRGPENFPISLGSRAASNPGASGHGWVRNRFISDEALVALRHLGYRDPTPLGMVFSKEAVNEKGESVTTQFVPARVADNPSINVDKYVAQMRQGLPALLVERLLAGDWSVSEGSLLKIELLRYVQVDGEGIRILGHDGKSAGEAFSTAQCQRFAVIDTAGADEDIEKKRKGKEPSWSVCGIFDWHREKQYLMLKFLWRKRVGWLEQVKEIQAFLIENNCREVYIEDKHWGGPLIDTLGANPKLQIHPIVPIKDKVARSTDLQDMMNDGRFFLPVIGTKGSGVVSWRKAFESEFMSWTGSKEELSDQIDVCSYAAGLVGSLVGGWSLSSQTGMMALGNRFKVVPVRGL